MGQIEARDCSPERLMGLVREGRSEALDQITRCYGEKLLQAGRRHCRSSAEAEDAVQDTLLVASEKIATLRDDAALEGWLVRVVASACRRIGRGHKNAAQHHDSDAGAGPEDRSLLLLSELEDFSAAEIGARLGLSPGAVRTRLSRLRDRLMPSSQGDSSSGCNVCRARWLLAGMSVPIVVDSLSFAHEVLKSDLPVLLDVSTEWCPPCKAAKPVVAELARRHAGRLKVVLLDGDEAAELVATLGVRGFPTFLCLRNGEIVARQAGFGGKRGLEALAVKLLGS